MQNPTPKRPSRLLVSCAGMLGALLLADQASRADAARRDPEDNLVFELHTYFDHDNSGKYNHSYAYEVARVGPRVSPTIGVERLRPFSEWLKRHQVRGFIGEYSAPANPDLDPRWLETLEHTLAYMREHCLASPHSPSSTLLAVDAVRLTNPTE